MKTTFKAAMFATTIALGLSVAACGKSATTEDAAETPDEDTMVDETVVEEPATDAMGDATMTDEATTDETATDAATPAAEATEEAAAE